MTVTGGLYVHTAKVIPRMHIVTEKSFSATGCRIRTTNVVEVHNYYLISLHP